MARYAVELVYADNVEERLATRPRHREFLRGLVERGKLLVSGPFADEVSALLVFEAADEDEVRALLADDPYGPVNAVKEIRIREWNAILGTWLAE